MRWQRLFDDLEAQLEAAEAAELVAEVAERTRRETALLQLVDRLRPALGAPLVVHLPGPELVRGQLLDCGADWLLVEEPGQREVLVALAAVLGLSGLGARAEGLGARAEGPGGQGGIARRLDLRWALRGLARARTGVELGLVDGSRVTGTLDRVGADHVDVAEHAPGEPRRAGAVRQVRLVPLRALVLVRSG